MKCPTVKFEIVNSKKALVNDEFYNYWRFLSFFTFDKFALFAKIYPPSIIKKINLFSKVLVGKF